MARHRVALQGFRVGKTLLWAGVLKTLLESSDSEHRLPGWAGLREKAVLGPLGSP